MAKVFSKIIIFFSISATKRSPGNFCLSNPTRLHHSEKIEEKKKELVPIQHHVMDDQSYFRSGIFRHWFGFKSVYNPFVQPRAVTTRHRDYVMVDFIFYSRRYSQNYSKFIENNLKLLARLNLYTEKDCVEMGHLPNKTCPSDHLCLLGKFLWTKT